MKNYLIILLLAVMQMAAVSCTNTTKQQPIAESASIESDTLDTLDADSLVRPLSESRLDSVTVIQKEDSDSMDGWIEVEPGLGAYYKDVMLTMPVVEIINPQLKMYLADYIVPMVKDMGFDKYNNFIFVKYVKNTDSGATTDKIKILVDYCGMMHYIALAIYQGKYQVSFVDGIPVMFENFKNVPFLKKTQKVYEYRRWRKSFTILITCDLESEFYFSVVGQNIHFTGYEDWGLCLVKSESDIPPVWTPEHVVQKDNQPTDSILQEPI